MSKEVELTEENLSQVTVPVNLASSNLPKSTSSLVSTDKRHLVLSNFSYTINDILDIDQTHISTIVTDLIIGLKYMTGKLKKKTKHVLNNLNLCFPSGTSTIIVGAPGCGSTSLLNAIYDNLDKKYLSGNIIYNGKKITEYKNWKRVASYCSQYDYHNALLTAKETLEFSKMLQFGNESFHKSKKTGVSNTDLNNKVNELLDVLGLKNCENTYLGGLLVKGCSGGEKRRVTVGEMLLGFHKILLLDKFSTGLDSAITKDITKFLTSYAKEMNNIVITAMIQPDPEIIPYFDQLIVLEEGSVIYCGNPKTSMLYFNNLGYRITGNSDVGSFLSNIGNEGYRKEIIRKMKIEDELHHKLSSITNGENENDNENTKTKEDEVQPVESTKPQQSDNNSQLIKKEELIKHYLNSKEHKEVEEYIKECNNNKSEPLESSINGQVYTSNYSLSQLSMLRYIFQRQFKLLIRDKLYVAGILVGYLIASVFLGYVFYDISSIENKLSIFGVFEFVLILLLFGPVAEFGTILEQRRVLAKQITGKYFSIPTFVLSTMVVEWPNMLIQPIVGGTPLYFISKLSRSDNYKHFGIFTLAAIMTSFAITPLIRLLMFGIPSEFVALASLPFMVFILTLFTGFSVPYDAIPWVFRWIYYINPVSYGHKIMAVNEFLSGDYENGPANLATLSFPTDDKDMWKWFVILVAMHFIFTFLTAVVLYLRKYKADYSVIAEEQEIEVNENERIPINQKDKESVSLTFKNINVYVNNGFQKKKKQLLYNISGYAKSGTLTALMGASGAGKSTLLDALSHTSTKTKVTGDILFNGQKLSLNTQSHVLGYVEQADNLPTKETVEEVLFFNARLRLSSKLSNEDINKKVDEVVKVLSLEDYRKIIIGNPGSGISMAIRKLIMTGIELVADPAILFLDEPTTGLDSKSALMVVKVLNRIAEYGKCVVCTIHQPSFEIFQLFSNILLLESGGKTVYLGDTGMNGEKLVNYFHQIEGIPKLQEGQNPASWILEVTGAGTSVEFKSYAENYEKSELRKKNIETIQQLEEEGKKKSKLEFPKYTASIFTRSYYYTKKISKFYWRCSSYTLSRIAVTILISVILGGVYYQTTPNTIGGVQSYMASLFSCSLFISVFSAVAALPALISERNSIYRDMDKHLTSPFAVLVAFTISEIPYSILCCLLSTCTIYPMVGYSSDSDKVSHFLLLYFALLMFSSFFGQWIAFTAPNLQISLFVTMAFLLLMNCITGFIIPNKDLLEFFQGLNYINPVSFFFNSVMTTQIHCDKGLDCTKIRLVNGFEMHINMYLDKVMDLHFDERWLYAMGLLIYIVVTRIAVYFSFKYIRYLP